MKRISITFLLAILIISACTSIPGGKTEGITIGEIQGCNQVSPFNKDKVTGVEGIVTHKFSNGFTMQSQKNDDLPCSSEAIFVMTGNYPSVFPGQMVIVDGMVNEFTPGKPEDHNLSRTELHDPKIKVVKENVILPPPEILGSNVDNTPSQWIKQTSDFDIKKNGLDYYESLEFMLVEIESGIVVGPKNQYNEFFVLPNGYVTANSISLQGVLLQKKSDENPEKILVDVSSSFTQDVNVGDTFDKPIFGIMDYSFGNYKIWTIKNPVIQSNKVSITSIKSDDQNLRIASYNIENFSRFDKESRVRKLGCQIARDLHSPDIVMLHEVLDDSGVADDREVSSAQTLLLLVQAIDNCGGDRYLFSDNPPINNQDGGIEGGNIRSVVLYREDLELILDPPTAGISGFDIQDGKMKINHNPLRLFSRENEFVGTRKPTMWIFTYQGEQYILMGLHLVSQSANSPDWGSLHPLEKPEEKKRVMQMNLVGNYIKDILSQNPTLNLILLGDFNDYPWSETLKVLNTISLSVLASSENPNEGYSYIHDGNGFQFDYAAVSNNLAERIFQYTIPHLNTFINVNDQISDHDPVYVEISGN